jgi:hypothetical protein
MKVMPRIVADGLGSANRGSVVVYLTPLHRRYAHAAPNWLYHTHYPRPARF